MTNEQFLKLNRIDPEHFQSSAGGSINWWLPNGDNSIKYNLENPIYNKACMWWLFERCSSYCDIDICNTAQVDDLINTYGFLIQDEKPTCDKTL